MAVYCIVLAVACTVFLHAEAQGCYQATGNLTYSNSTAPQKKPPIAGPPTRIRLLHDPLGYGFLGDQCVPGYNLTSPGLNSSNHKWRVICRAPSRIFVILLAIDMPAGEYLQVRRRSLGGSSTRFHSHNLNLNSVLFGHVNKTEDGGFRLAYICASRDSGGVADQLILNRDVLDYIQGQPQGIDKIGYILRNITVASLSQDPIVRKIIRLGGVRH